MRIVCVFFLALVVATVSACDRLLSVLESSTASQPQAVDEALVQRGIEVYHNNYCGVCHTLAAASTNGTFGPPHDAAASLAEQRIVTDTYRGSATTAAEYLRESIVEPAVYLVPEFAGSQHHMPPFGHLPPEDIDAMVYLLLQQRGGS